MFSHATGPFDVRLSPVDDKPVDLTLGHMRIEKKYYGDLVASATGQMLTAGSPAKGAAGYVAIETVSGTLGGRNGSFALQHNGTMAGEKRELFITIVPGSGTGQLEGISGKMNITIAPDGKHSYDLDYMLPAHI